MSARELKHIFDEHEQRWQQKLLRTAHTACRDPMAISSLFPSWGPHDFLAQLSYSKQQLRNHSNKWNKWVENDHQATLVLLKQEEPRQARWQAFSQERLKTTSSTMSTNDAHSSIVPQPASRSSGLEFRQYPNQKRKRATISDNIANKKACNDTRLPAGSFEEHVIRGSHFLDIALLSKEPIPTNQAFTFHNQTPCERTIGQLTRDNPAFSTTSSSMYTPIRQAVPSPLILSHSPTTTRARSNMAVQFNRVSSPRVSPRGYRAPKMSTSLNSSHVRTTQHVPSVSDLPLVQPNVPYNERHLNRCFLQTASNHHVSDCISPSQQTQISLHSAATPFGSNLRQTNNDYIGRYVRQSRLQPTGSQRPSNMQDYYFQDATATYVQRPCAPPVVPRAAISRHMDGVSTPQMNHMLFSEAQTGVQYGQQQSYTPKPVYQSRITGLEPSYHNLPSLQAVATPQVSYYDSQYDWLLSGDLLAHHDSDHQTDQSRQHDPQDAVPTITRDPGHCHVPTVPDTNFLRRPGQVGYSGRGEYNSHIF